MESQTVSMMRRARAESLASKRPAAVCSAMMDSRVPAFAPMDAKANLMAAEPPNSAKPRTAGAKFPRISSTRSKAVRSVPMAFGTPILSTEGAMGQSDLCVERTRNTFAPENPPESGMSSRVFASRYRKRSSDSSSLERVSAAAAPAAASAAAGCRME
eukprot:Amastigsp_a678820_5.p4 type:complete len:158 gc:universal Amastigsp_a678820_5:1198-725(-)